MSEYHLAVVQALLDAPLCDPDVAIQFLVDLRGVEEDQERKKRPYPG